jgi:hypothetical protein
MNQSSSRDLELLSAYLDEQLSQADAARLVSRIKADPELRSAYENLRQTRALLRKLPARRAPRNFRLTPQMVGVKPTLPRSFPIFRFASVLASVLLLLGYAINLTAPAASMAAITNMAYDAYSAPASTEAPAPEMATAPLEEATATAETPNALAPKLSTTATAEESLTQQYDSSTLTPDAKRGMAVTAEAMVSPQPPALPIHPGWLFGLLGLAVVSGAGAWVVRARAEQKWGKTKPSAKEIAWMVLAFVVVLVLAIGIFWMSTQ